MRAAPKVKKKKPAPKKGRVADTRELGAAGVPETAGAEPCKTPIEAVPEVPALDGVSNKERYELIAEAAYYLAEQRNFDPGHELEDWLSAEEEIERMLSKSGEENPPQNS